MEKLSDIREDALIDRLTAGLSFGPDVIAGPGDDCAVLKSRDEAVYDLLKTDCIVEGVHFKCGEAPEKVGWKAICRALSDIAAMGGTPGAALITIVVSPDRSVDEIEGWYRGIRRAAEEFAVDLIGGETSSLPPGDSGAVLSVSVKGWVEKSRCAFRGGAGIGDRIAVTGELGGSLASGRHLDFRPRLGEGRWLTANAASLTAMMDISDGLAKDLPRLARASGTGYRIDTGAIPRSACCPVEMALGDGEDYELLLTLDADAAENILSDWRKEFPELSLTMIGEITEAIETPLDGGWEHFSKA